MKIIRYQILQDSSFLCSKLEIGNQRLFLHKQIGENTPHHYRSWVSVMIKLKRTAIHKPKQMPNFSDQKFVYEHNHFIDSFNVMETLSSHSCTMVTSG